MERALDGNTAAGALADLFVPEMTGALMTCASCGDARQVGELPAYVDAPGVVLRCASCGSVEARLVRAGERGWLDLRGVRVLEFTLGA